MRGHSSFHDRIEDTVNEPIKKSIPYGRTR